MSEPAHHPAPPGGHTKGTVNIPGVGRLPTWAVVGGVGVVGVLIVMHYRNASSSAAAAAAPAGQQTDPAGNVGTIDPSTGYVYGSPEDTAALAAAAGTTGATSADTGTIADQVTSGPPFTSNAAWSQYAVSVLESNGYDPGTLSAELGAYLAGQSVTAAQEADINAAVGVAGYPPVAGANGYPPAINVSGSKAGTGSSPAPAGGGPSSGVPAGSSSGSTAAKGGPITVTPVNLHTTQVNTTSVQVAWLAPTIPAGQGPLTGYTAQVFNSNGTAEGSSWNVPAGQLYANAGGLKSKTAYHINVWCEPAKTGGPHATVNFTTT